MTMADIQHYLKRTELDGDFATRLHLKPSSSKNDDFRRWPPLAVESSFSYAHNSRVCGKSSEILGKYRRRSTDSLSGTTATFKDCNKVQSNYSERWSVVENKQTKSKMSELSLKGKRLRLSPHYWKSEMGYHQRSQSEPLCRNIAVSRENGSAISGIQTFGSHAPPISNANLQFVLRPGDYTSPQMNHRHRRSIPQYNPPILTHRPLGHFSLASPVEHLGHKKTEARKPWEDLVARGVKQPSSARQRRNSSRPPPSSCQLRRTSSRESFRNRIHRTRSASLPVPGKQNKSYTVMEKEGEMANGTSFSTQTLQVWGDEIRVNKNVTALDSFSNDL